MFQLKKCKKGIIQHEGHGLKITVPRTGGLVDGILWALIVLPMVCGFFVLIPPCSERRHLWTFFGRRCLR
jgi:hypothetical protein